MEDHRSKIPIMSSSSPNESAVSPGTDDSGGGKTNTHALLVGGTEAHAAKQAIQHTF